MSTRFKSLFAKNGILHLVSFPYTPKQNGYAERKHGHTVETGLTLLFNANMPPQSWVDAFVTATYLINRMLTRTLQSSSPWKCCLVILQITPPYVCLVAPALRGSVHTLTKHLILTLSVCFVRL